MTKERRVFEPVDDTPVEWPIGVKVPETMEQKIARMVRTSVSQYAANQGAETFEEANDFDIDDPEDLPRSVHEMDRDQEELDLELAHDRRAVKLDPRYLDEAQRRRAAAHNKKNPPPPGDGGNPRIGGEPPPPSKDAE